MAAPNSAERLRAGLATLATILLSGAVGAAQAGANGSDPAIHCYSATVDN